MSIWLIAPPDSVKPTPFNLANQTVFFSKGYETKRISVPFSESLFASVETQSAVRDNGSLIAHIDGEVYTPTPARDNQPSGGNFVNEKLVLVIKTLLQVDNLLMSTCFPYFGANFGNVSTLYFFSSGDSSLKSPSTTDDSKLLVATAGVRRGLS